MSESDFLRFEVEVNLMGEFPKLAAQVSVVGLIRSIADDLNLENYELEYEEDHIRRYAVYFNGEDEIENDVRALVAELEDNDIRTGAFRHFEPEHLEVLKRVREDHPWISVVHADGR